jgi:hypothetical protein
LHKQLQRAKRAPRIASRLLAVSWFCRLLADRSIGFVAARRICLAGDHLPATITQQRCQLALQANADFVDGRCVRSTGAAIVF